MLYKHFGCIESSMLGDKKCMDEDRTLMQLLLLLFC